MSEQDVGLAFEDTPNLSKKKKKEERKGEQKLTQEEAKIKGCARVCMEAAGAEEAEQTNCQGS